MATLLKPTIIELEVYPILENVGSLIPYDIQAFK